ncbi:hypothetical protein [Okeania sp. KiyG1]|uniref:hypothetical protein n=1 Tax=Okeania sp. KiyG1 TaxID=2720165 RepID=UPI001920580C|nr:hypothetical protein [Okeania sp. KiyG1]
MLTAYQYKLRPNKKQLATIELCLELLHRQYNYWLGHFSYLLASSGGTALTVISYQYL